MRQLCQVMRVAGLANRRAQSIYLPQPVYSYPIQEIDCAVRALQSMSWRGNCYDNAESFWSRFKAKPLNYGSFPGLTEARLEISHHIVYYNA